MARHAAPSVMTSFSCCQNEPGPPSGRKGEADRLVEEVLGPEALDGAHDPREQEGEQEDGDADQGDERPDPRAQPGDHHREPDDAEREAEQVEERRLPRPGLDERVDRAGDHPSPGRGDGRGGSGRRRWDAGPPGRRRRGAGRRGRREGLHGWSAAGGDRLVLRDVDGSRWRQGRAGEVGGRRSVGPGAGRVAFDGEPGDEPVQPAGQPPVACGRAAPSWRARAPCGRGWRRSARRWPARGR